jgi:hypothetical protein
MYLQNDPYEAELKRERQLRARDVGRANRGRKHPNRKKSTRSGGGINLVASARADAEKLKAEMSDREKERNATLFSHLFEGAAISSDPYQFWKAVGRSGRRYILSKSRKARLDAVVAGYALWWHMRAAGTLVARHLEVIRQQASAHCPRSHDFIDLVLSIVNDYSVVVEDGAVIVDARALSRDAQAIRHLIATDTPPWKVSSFPGGLDKWSREIAAQNRLNKDAELEARLESQAQELPDDYDPTDCLIGKTGDASNNAISLVGQTQQSDPPESEPLIARTNKGSVTEAWPQPADSGSAGAEERANQTYVAKFNLEPGEHLFLILEGDESLTGAYLVKAWKRAIPGTAKMKKRRLAKMMKSWNDRAITLKV